MLPRLKYIPVLRVRMGHDGDNATEESLAKKAAESS